MRRMRDMGVLRRSPFFKSFELCVCERKGTMGFLSSSLSWDSR
jgi:hypothetical protein